MIASFLPKAFSDPYKNDFKLKPGPLKKKGNLMNFSGYFLRIIPNNKTNNPTKAAAKFVEFIIILSLHLVINVLKNKMRGTGFEPA